MSIVQILVCLLVFVLSWPFLNRLFPKVKRNLYHLQMEYLEMEGKAKGWRLLIQKIEPLVWKEAITWLDRLMRLSGRPFGDIRAIEVIVFQILVFVGGLLLSTQMKQPQPVIVLDVLVLFFPIRLMLGKKRKRQFHASECMRILKRRFAMSINRGLPVNDALREMADLAPRGEFKQVFTRFVNQIESRPLQELMNELSLEFEVRELTDFCMAVAYAEANSQTLLPDLIDRQIKVETSRTDEFIANKAYYTNEKLNWIGILSTVWTLALAGYFFYYFCSDKFSHGVPIF